MFNSYNEMTGIAIGNCGILWKQEIPNIGLCSVGLETREGKNLKLIFTDSDKWQIESFSLLIQLCKRNNF